MKVLFPENYGGGSEKIQETFSEQVFLGKKFFFR